MQIRNVKVTSQMNAEMSIDKTEETWGAKQIILLDKTKKQTSKQQKHNGKCRSW